MTKFANLLSEHEAASEANESVRTWQRRRQLRQGPAFIRVGTRIFYRPEAIDEWLSSLEVDPYKSTAA